MDRNDRLYENYENALFQLLMDQVAQEEGARLIAENERLKDDPASAVPPELDRRSRETIRRAFAGRGRRRAHTAGWYLSKIAVAILAALLLFITAYATIPELRLRTWEVLIENSDVASRLSFASGGHENFDHENGKQTLAGYSLPDVPRDYLVVDQGETSRSARIEYAHEDGTSIFIRIAAASDLFLDSEDMDEATEVEIQGKKGKLYKKNEFIIISWYDDEQEKIIELRTKQIDAEMTLSYAEQIKFVQ